MDLVRLRRAVAAGDADAARELLSEAERRADSSLVIEARAALGDHAGLLDLLERAWREDDAECLAIGRVLGLVLDAPTRAALDELYADVRGRARDRIFAHREVLALLARARHEPAGWFLERAGRPRAARQRAMTALAVRDEAAARITFGLSWCRHRTIFSGPGSCNYAPDNTGWTRELGRWPLAGDNVPWHELTDERRRMLDAWAAGGDGRVFVASCEPGAGVPATRAAGADDAPWRAALELLLTREPSVSAWQDLADLLAAWPGGVDPALAAGIREVLDARWPDTLRARAVVDQRRWWPSSPAVATDWPIATRLSLTASLAEIDAIASLEALELTRHVDLSDTTPAAISAELARHHLAAVCDEPRLAAVTGLTLDLSDARLVHLLERTDWLARLTSLSVDVCGMVPPLDEVARGAELLARTPALRHLELGGDFAAALVERADVPPLPQLEALTLHTRREARALAALLELLAAGGVRLRALDLSGYASADVEVVGASAHAPSLRRLVMRDLVGTLTQPELATLCSRLDLIEHLSLELRQTGDAGERLGDALARAPWLERLQTLGLGGVPLGADGARALVSNGLPRSLRHLALTRCALGSDGLEVLCEAGWLAELEVLTLRDDSLGGAAVAALLRSSSAPRRLRELDLSDNKLGERAATALAAWPHASGLARLWLGTVGARGVEALNTSPHVLAELGGNSRGYRPPPWRALCARSGGAA